MSLVQYAPLGEYVPLGTYRYLGAPTPGRPQLLFGVLIDWDNDHAFDGRNEARWMVPGGLEVERGRENYVRPDGSGFERIGVGRCAITLDNSYGYYDARNTTSPLYPHLLNKKERDAWVYVKNGDSGSRYDLITGRLVDFKPSSDRRGRKTFKLFLEDGIRYLQQNDTSVDLQDNIDTHLAIGKVLDDINWPWGRALDAAVDTIPHWWVFSRSSYAEIMDIAESELGIFFVAADGKATFYNRFNADTAPLVLNGSEISPEIHESQPSETVKDKVILRIHPRIQRATATVWTLQDVPIFIANGETKTYWPEFTYENRPVPIKNPLCVAATDYNMFANSDGTGANLTSGQVVTFTPLGQGGKLTIKNNSGSGAWIINLKMRGDALDSPDALQVTAGDGENVIKIDLTWQQKAESGQDNADFIHEFLSNPDKYFLTISIQGSPAKQFGYDLFRGVDLTIAHRSISDLFRISKIKHQLLKRRVVDTTYWLEPSPAFASGNVTQLSFQVPARFGEPP